MARSMWSGVLSFGLVSVPVALYSATENKDIHYHQLNEDTGNQVKYRKVDAVSGEEVTPEKIISGFDLGAGNHVTLTKDELENLAPAKSETIEITSFIQLDTIDPVYFEKTYYVGPRGKGGERAYALLFQAMQKTGQAGVATFVMRGKEHLALVRAGEKCLVMETLQWADEVRDPVTELPPLPEVTFEGREVEMATMLIESLAAPWEPGSYHDEYRDQIMELIEAKRDGREVVTAQAATPQASVGDLMSMLEASVKASRATDTKPRPRKARK